MYFFKFNVKGSFHGLEDFSDNGLVCGANYTEAVDFLENYYGEAISELHIEIVTDKGQPYLFEKTVQN